MILKGLFKKLKFVLLLIVITIVIIVVVKILKLKPEVEKMIKDELGFSKLKKSKVSSSEESEEKEKPTSWEDRIGSFLFPARAQVHAQRKVRTEAPEETVDVEDEGLTPKKQGRDKVRRSGSKTSTYKREEMCRVFLENYFDDYFPTCRPKFLVNPKTGKPLELDGYNARLNLAFEHQGKQHRVYTPRFHASLEEFEKQQERDAFKRERLEELGIDLIEISDEVPTPDLDSFLGRAVQLLGH